MGRGVERGEDEVGEKLGRACTGGGNAAMASSAARASSAFDAVEEGVASLPSVPSRFSSQLRSFGAAKVLPSLTDRNHEEQVAGGHRTGVSATRQFPLAWFLMPIRQDAFDASTLPDPPKPLFPPPSDQF